MDFPPIPDFLLVANRTELSPEQQARLNERLKAAGHAKRKKRQRFDLPKTREGPAWALLKQIEKDKADKQAERFRRLRERNK